MKWVVAAMIWAIQPPTGPPAGTPPVSEAPKPAEPTKPPEPAKPKVMENTGKPMVLEPVCGTAEIHDFGMACAEDDPCPVYLELSSLAAVGNKLFVAGNLHEETVTLWSVLMASEDAGKSWSEPFPRIRTGSLEDLQFVDAETGFVSGHLAQNLPRDPFFLRTADGGKTWRRSALLTDPEIAVIDFYQFADKQNGVLLLDRSRGGEYRARYQRYETNTGGDVWGLRETSPKPIPIKKREAAAPPEWRLRVDPKLKAHRVERRQGQRWMAVASFLVEAGSCKPDTAPAAPPPETPPATPPPVTISPAGPSPAPPGPRE